MYPIYFDSESLPVITDKSMSLISQQSIVNGALGSTIHVPLLVVADGDKGTGAKRCMKVMEELAKETTVTMNGAISKLVMV